MSEELGEPGPSTLEKRGWTFGRVAAVCAFLGIAIFWAWALSPLNNPTHPDELESTAFVDEAEAICAVFVDDIDALAKANTVNSPAERAPLVDQGTALTTALVADLRQLAPADTTEDGVLVAAWLEDWDVYIADRDAYSVALSAGETGPFAVTARDGEQISEYIDAFATINTMHSCVVPLDV